MTLEEQLAEHLGNSWTPYIGKPGQLLNRDKVRSVKARKPGMTPAKLRLAMEYAKNAAPPVPEDQKTVIPMTREPTLQEIIKVVSEETGIKVMCLISHRRQAPTVRARMMYFHAARECTSKTFPQIARDCGNRDHTTVMHGINKIKALPGLFEPELGKVLARLQKLDMPAGIVDA